MFLSSNKNIFRELKVRITSITGKTVKMYHRVFMSNHASFFSDHFACWILWNKLVWAALRWEEKKLTFLMKCLRCIHKRRWLAENDCEVYKNKNARAKRAKRTRITQSGKNYAINCAIQGVRLIWKQKIWLAICGFLWPLPNQNTWFVSPFCTELTLFCTVKKKLHFS